MSVLWWWCDCKANRHITGCVDFVDIAMSYSYLFKYIIIGDTGRWKGEEKGLIGVGVGKSCLLLQFTDKRFQPVHDLTIGVEFGARMINIGDKQVKLQIWDTVGFGWVSLDGSRPVRSLSVLLLAPTTVELLALFLCTISPAVRLSRSWPSGWRRLARTDPLTWSLCWSETSPIWATGLSLFVAMIPSRAVTTEEGAKFAEENGLIFLETSAKTAANVEEVWFAFADVHFMTNRLSWRLPSKFITTLRAEWSMWTTRYVGQMDFYRRIRMIAYV